MAGRFQYYSINSDSCFISSFSSSSFFFLFSNICQSCQPILDSRFVSSCYSAPSFTSFFFLFLFVLFFFSFVSLFLIFANPMWASSFHLPFFPMAFWFSHAFQLHTLCWGSIVWFFFNELQLIILIRHFWDFSSLSNFLVCYLFWVVSGWLYLSFCFYPAIILFNHFWDFFFPNTASKLVICSMIFPEFSFKVCYLIWVFLCCFSLVLSIRGVGWMCMKVRLESTFWDHSRLVEFFLFECSAPHFLIISSLWIHKIWWIRIL